MDEINFSQVVTLQEDSQINKLLDLGWILLETIGGRYVDGEAYILSRLGNPGLTMNLEKIFKNNTKGASFTNAHE